MALGSRNWARVKVEGPYRLRRGAWYAVSAIVEGEVLIRARKNWVRVPFAAIELSETPPTRWSVVPRPANAVMLPETWGPNYGVCPQCHFRASLERAPQTLRCPHCVGLFAVAWDEGYLRG